MHIKWSNQDWSPPFGPPTSFGCSPGFYSSCRAWFKYPWGLRASKTWNQASCAVFFIADTECTFSECSFCSGPCVKHSMCRGGWVLSCVKEFDFCQRLKKKKTYAHLGLLARQDTKCQDIIHIEINLPRGIQEGFLEEEATVLTVKSWAWRVHAGAEWNEPRQRQAYEQRQGSGDILGVCK